MARLFFVFALILQISLIYGDEINDSETDSQRQTIVAPPSDDKVPELRATDSEWIDLLTMSQGNLFPASALAKMTQATSDPNESDEEKVEKIKAMTNHINLVIQNEMANLLTYAIKDAEITENDNQLRQKRSLDNPMASTKMINRLLKYIKSNNEYQNSFIDEMMSAQEIAEKFGIDYTPDPDIFADLAMASSKQTEELASILNDVSEAKNVTKEHVEFVPVNNEPIEKSNENSTYYVYSTNVSEEDLEEHLNTPPHFEYVSEHFDSHLPVNQMFYEFYPQHQYHYNIPFETQIASPPIHLPPPSPVTYMPSFLEPVAFFPEFYPQYYMEPMTTTTTIILPFEDCVEPEPELFGEEFEETVISKYSVDRGEDLSSATVNHQMTYTISEKSHYRQPQTKNIPQQMQYYFFLM